MVGEAIKLTLEDVIKKLVRHGEVARADGEGNNVTVTWNGSIGFEERFGILRSLLPGTIYTKSHFEYRQNGTIYNIRDNLTS